MRSIVIALLLVCAVSLSSATAGVVSRIAAVVNKDIITTLQLDQKLQEQLAKQQRQPTPAQLGALRQEMLSRMIEETLVQQRIKALKLSVSEQEVETALLDVQRKNKLSREELEEAVLVQGLEFDAYRENLSQQILRMKLIGQEVRSQVDVPESEVREYYNAHQDEYRLNPKVKLSAITFPVSEKASEQERVKIAQMAEQALGRLLKAEEFDAVVASYKDTYGASGGEMGHFVFSDLTPEFVEAIDGIPAGGYSRPVATAQAVHLLRVDERFTGGFRAFEEVRNEIYQNILDQKTDTRLKEWTRALKAKSFIDIRL